MRTSLCVLAALGSVMAGALVSGVGCGSVPDNCEARLTCVPPSPPTCIPSESAGPVADSCGVFVSSSKGTDGAEGTKLNPLKTLEEAIAKAKSQSPPMPVYACAEGFTGPLTIDAGIELYGALDCTQEWAYIGALAKTTLTADPDKVPLTLTSGDSGGKVLDFSIEAAHATIDGGSSIAVIADQAKASFIRCEITAGNGKAGPAGATPVDPVGPSDPSDAAIVGNIGLVACTNGALPTPGALSKENMFCPVSQAGPFGGAGGIGTASSGSNGDAMPFTPQTATGGLGQLAVDPTWSCGGVGKGHDGSDGLSGMPGNGASGGISNGEIDATGYKGIAGFPGLDGANGQGGGGGGGAKGKVGICGGASGGSGGAGGCGGHGGKGGDAGGASIGVISIMAQLTFTTVTIKVGNGGDGGSGGEGEFGGRGGNGGNGGNGNGTSPACNGGNGGNGGQGGKGGGGRGGHVIGVAYRGLTAPDTKAVTFVRGTPGLGGQGADATTAGEKGLQEDTTQFQ